MQNQDWNSQYIQHVDAKARADTIRQTVREALDEPCGLTSAMQSTPGMASDINHADGLQHDPGHLEPHLYWGSQA